MRLRKVHFLKHRCKACGLCVLFCPTKVLKMSDQLNDQGLAYPELVDFDNCNGCGICFRMCPDCAIEIREVEASVAVKENEHREEQMKQGRTV